MNKHRYRSLRQKLRSLGRLATFEDPREKMAAQFILEMHSSFDALAWRQSVVQYCRAQGHECNPFETASRDLLVRFYARKQAR